MQDYTQERDVAMEAARRAGEVILTHYQEFQVIPDAPADISTAADKASQEVILQTIKESFPQDALSAEETTESLAEVSNVGERLWIVDPIDGSRGFARKNGEFSVMIGFIAESIIQIGVVLEPALPRLTYAIHGQGCWCVDGPEGSPRQCQVTTTGNLSEALLTQSHSKGEPMESWTVTKLGVPNVKESYSAGIKLAMVARGEADLYIADYTRFRDWDICAGQILVEEAGGKVSGLAGQTLTYGSPDALQAHGLLATNGTLHDSTLAKLQ